MRSGRIKLNDITKFFHRVNTKCKVSAINEMLKKYGPELVDEIKNYLINRVYLQHGFTYDPLDPKWVERKNPQYKDHFHIDTTDMIENISYKVSGAQLKARVGKKFERQFDTLEEYRPIVEEGKEIIAKKILERINEEYAEMLRKAHGE